jgi:hypothetical protein
MTLRRREVVKDLLKGRKGLLVVAGLGSTAWDITAAGDHDLSFPMWGAMGQAAMIGLGLALAQPKRRVLVITGDGEMLMGIGSLATIGVQQPKNLTVAVIDNERYGETGMQATHTADGVDLAAVATACGFKTSKVVTKMRTSEKSSTRPRPELPADQGRARKAAARASAARRRSPQGPVPESASRRASEKTLASARAPASPRVRSRSRAGRS